MKETITLNTQEQKRVMVLNRLLVGQLTAAEAAVLLSLSERQVRRLCAAYRKEGEARLAHGNRGRKPIQTISEEVRRQVIELATTTYAGCNYQHLRDLLAERDGIQLSRTSVRRIRLPAGRASPRKQRLQLLPDAQRRSYAKARVQVHEHFDGHLSVHCAGRCVATTEAPLETSKMRTRSGPRGGTEGSTDSQTPSSAVVLLTQASTVELGESGACQVDQSTAPKRPAATHPWRKPMLKPKRTQSLDTEHDTITGQQQGIEAHQIA